MRIGLIAMNGIRIGDPGLIQLGLSSPGLRERVGALESLPSLALLTLAGMTPAAHQVDYLEVPSINSLTGIPGPFDLVGISSYSAQIHEAYELARRLREHGTTVVMGGPHVTCLPAEAAEHCDAVAIGEGEPIWLRILGDFQQRRLSKFYGSRASTFDLDCSPLPAFELLDASKRNRITIQTSRGCPHRCNFCASSGVVLSSRYKQKPVAKVLRELDKVRELWKRPFIEFVDDNAFVNKGYWTALLPELARRRVRWFAESDISVGYDRELLSLMRKSGCAEVLIGLESPTPVGLNGVELKSNWKLRMWAKYKEAVKSIQSQGIRVIGCFVLGLDGHTQATAASILKCAEELELFDVQVTVQTPFPGTPLYETLKQQGRLLSDNQWSKCTLFDVNFSPAGMTPGQLERAFRELCEQLYSPELVDRRRRSFRSYLRAAANPVNSKGALVAS